MRKCLVILLAFMLFGCAPMNIEPIPEPEVPPIIIPVPEPEPEPEPEPKSEEIYYIVAPKIILGTDTEYITVHCTPSKTYTNITVKFTATHIKSNIYYEITANNLNVTIIAKQASIIQLPYKLDKLEFKVLILLEFSGYIV